MTDGPPLSRCGSSRQCRDCNAGSELATLSGPLPFSLGRIGQSVIISLSELFASSSNRPTLS